MDFFSFVLFITPSPFSFETHRACLFHNVKHADKALHKFKDYPIGLWLFARVVKGGDLKSLVERRTGSNPVATGFARRIDVLVIILL